MSRIVKQEGPPEAKIVFVGEAPGSQEERIGRPFVGPSGIFFDECLRTAGINRRECYITNVVKVKPPNNDISYYIDLSKAIPKITSEGQKWLDEFHNEIKYLFPNVIVPLGNVPLWALTGLKMITKRRGSILQSDGGVKVIPTIHPAAALREYMYKYAIIGDLRRIKKESEFPEIILKDYQLITAPTYSEVMSHLMSIMGQKRCTLDIETLGKEISCIGIGHPFKTMSIPFCSEEGPYFTEQEEADIWGLIAEICQDRSILKVGQNLAFDSTFLFMKYGIIVSPIDDCMVAQGILAPDLPKGLDYTTSVYTDVPYYKDDGKEWFKLGGSFKDLWLYNTKDCAVLNTILPAQLAQLNKQQNIVAYNNQVKLIEPIVYMSSRGIQADVQQLRKLSDEAGSVLDGLMAAFHDECGYECDPKSPAQLKELFYVRRNHKPYINRSTKKVTTDRDALKRLSRKGDRAAKLLLEIRTLAKFKATYYDAIVDPDGRLRSSFNPVGTTSGRLSSSKTIFKSGLNFQNIPDKVRRCMLVDEGYMGYEVDLSQAENRVVAYIAPDHLMMEAFERGIDVHRLTASLIFGKKIEEISNEPGSTPIGGGIYSERFWGKKANHGLNYDLGYKTFAFLYEIPESDAKYIVERYHSAYPGVRRYHEWVRHKLSTSRSLQDCLGKTRIFLDRWGEGLFKEAYSFIPQSTVAGKLNKDGVLHMWGERFGRFNMVELLNQVHDSIWFQIPMSLPLQNHLQILRTLKESLERPITWNATSFVIPAEFKLSPLNFGKKHKENPFGLRELTDLNSTDLLESVWREFNARGAEAK